MLKSQKLSTADSLTGFGPTESRFYFIKRKSETLVSPCLYFNLLFLLFWPFSLLVQFIKPEPFDAEIDDGCQNAEINQAGDKSAIHN